jgi:hypothetical protein
VGTTVDDLQTVWDRGFRELELIKRASLIGTGTCQGSACVPHLRAWIAERAEEAPPPFTARPASRQITLGEAAADVHIDAFRRTALHEEHLAAGAHMDRFGGWWRPWNYGDHLAEYRAVRESISIGTSPPWANSSSTARCGRVPPASVSHRRVDHPARAAPGMPLLNERGHVIDDG